jgi:hypothetical protein
MKGIVDQVKAIIYAGLNAQVTAGLTQEEIEDMPSLAEWYDINVAQLRQSHPIGVEYLGLITDEHWQELFHRAELDGEVDIWLIKTQ